MQPLKEYCHRALKEKQIEEQSHLFKTGHTYTFCNKYIFDVYEFVDYDLDDEFKDFNVAGLYCFTTEFSFAESKMKDGKQVKNGRIHSLFYLGKTDDFSTRKFSKHENFERFKALPTSKDKKFIGIYQCSADENAKDLESRILSKYNFADNTSENTNKKGLPTTIVENQAISSTREQ